MKVASAEQKRARGRPRSFDPDAALGRVLEVFWEKGFAATSMDELAAAAGLNRPNLNAAFGDKRAIYIAALSRFREDLREGLGATLDGKGRLSEQLNAFYDAAIDLYTSGGTGQRGCLVMCTAPAESVRDVEVRRIYREVQDEIDQTLTERFERAQTEGELSQHRDPKILGRIATAILQSLALRARGNLAEQELRDFARDSVSGLIA